jgi:hypothetical protein
LTLTEVTPSTAANAPSTELTQPAQRIPKMESRISSEVASVLIKSTQAESSII